MLTPKQQFIVDRASVVFAPERVTANMEAVERKLRSLPEIELMPSPTDAEVAALLNDVIYNPQLNNLFTSYIVPPFSTLDTRSGLWQDRRRALDEYLGDSLVGRKAGLAYGITNWTKKGTEALVGAIRKNDNGTSQFDSMLCELLLKWFGFSGCSVLDPFAGGHVRGAMASLLGYQYTGIDLSEEQIVANINRALELGLVGNINWINDDAVNVASLVPDNSFDLLFTCPPYGDLEKYSDDPRDLSNMGYADFAKNYGQAMATAMRDKLRTNRFAVVVVGDFRDKQGFYRGFVSDTIKIAESAGLKLYNEMILLNNIGTASLRANNNFRNRKMVKVHQNVLVFYKGDPGKIQSLYGAIDSKLPIPLGEKSTEMLF